MLSAGSAHGDNALVNNGTGGVNGGTNTGGNHCAGGGVTSATCA